MIKEIEMEGLSGSPESEKSFHLVISPVHHCEGRMAVSPRLPKLARNSTLRLATRGKTLLGEAVEIFLMLLFIKNKSV